MQGRKATFADMIRTFEIRNFRGFQLFRLDQLGEVNLLVGRNNSGKTSVLEALQLFVSNGHPRTLHSLLVRRGEFERAEKATTLAVRHLFHGHRLALGTRIELAAVREGTDSHSVVLEIREAHERPERVLAITPGSMEIPFQPNGSLDAHTTRRLGYLEDDTRSRAEYIATESVGELMFRQMLDTVVLTDEEDFFLDALRIVEPRIRRIVALGSAPMRSEHGARGGIVAKLDGVDARVPMGSMGDGVWRLASIALALVKARGGILVVDEIDTGLHYTVMDSMWKLVREGARRLNVQVFATTHSRDCVESLAVVCGDEGSTEVTIQRIEVEHATLFTERQIRLAAERGIEIR